MAVYVYRCAKCRGLFNTVIQGLCRACKTGDAGASASPAGSNEVNIIENSDPGSTGAVVVNPQALAPEFFISDGEKWVSANPKISELNRLTEQVFERNPSLGQFASPQSEFTMKPEDTVRFRDQFGNYGPEYKNTSGKVVRGRVVAGNRIALDGCISTIGKDGVVDVVDLLEFPGEIVGMRSESATQPVETRPEPHAAILNPKRKMRITE